MRQITGYAEVAQGASFSKKCSEVQSKKKGIGFADATCYTRPHTDSGLNKLIALNRTISKRSIRQSMDEMSSALIKCKY